MANNNNTNKDTKQPKQPGAPKSRLPFISGVKGIRISRMSALTFAGACVLYILLTVTVNRTAKALKETYGSIDDLVSCMEVEAMFTDGSDYLTEQARAYAATQNPEYMSHYFIEANDTRRRETALSRMARYDLEEDAETYLQSALDSSNALMEREIYAMRLAAEAAGESEASLPIEVQAVALSPEDQALTGEEKLDKAREIMFGAMYHASKREIENSVDYSMNSMKASIRARMQNSHKTFQSAMLAHEILIGVHFAEIAIGSLFTLLLVVLPMMSFVKHIRKRETVRVVGAYECKCLAQTYNAMFADSQTHAEQLRHQAEHDALTSILNRGAFDGLKQNLRNSGKPIGLLIIDVDKFKQVNDGYGHEMGDRVLKRVADMLSENFRSSDYPARIGGDEFSVIMTEAAPEQEDSILEKIEKINQALTHPTDDTPPVSLSVGGAFSDDGFTDDLYKRADLALYEVKEHGRRGARFYRKEMGVVA